MTLPAPRKSRALKKACVIRWKIAATQLPVPNACLLYTSDAADDLTRVDLGGRRIIKKKKKNKIFFFFKQKTAYEMLRSLVGSEMCIRDRRRRASSDGRSPRPNFLCPM